MALDAHNITLMRNRIKKQICIKVKCRIRIRIKVERRIRDLNWCGSAALLKQYP